MTDFPRLFQDFGIPTDPKVTTGWIGVPCPFCGDGPGKYHGGFSIGGGYFNCWKCGGRRNTAFVVAQILRTNQAEAEALLKAYDDGLQSRVSLNRKVARASVLSLPGAPLNPVEKAYLRDRGFRPGVLEKKYQVRGGGIAGDWKYRIIIPLIFRGRVVSWTARDITGRSDIRYKTLPIEESVINPKTIFYNTDNVPGRRVAVVEGPFDFIRMGDGFVSASGTSMTSAQLAFLARNYDEIFFVYDPEPLAQARARKYGEELAVMGKRVEILDTESDRDPGDETPENVERIRREIFPNFR